MTCTCYWLDIQDICSRFQDDCLPSGPVQTALQVLTIVGAVLSLIGIAVTIFTLLFFKWVSPGLNTLTRNCFHVYLAICTPSQYNMKIYITQETSRTRCHHISHPALHSSILFDDCLCVWYWPNKCLWRLRICVISDPLLYAGSCDVHGSRGCVHVSEADHCLWPNLHQVLCCCITYMLVWVYNSMRLSLGE